LNRLYIIFLIIFCVLGLLSFAGSKSILFAESINNVDLTELSIEELMSIEITSASKKEESLFDTPSAVYVITGEDIRRSGVTSIPEALRLAPGVEVAQLDANKWAITIRGFNERFSTKLLVLIDGRSIYTPFFAGVLWEEIDN
jgi:iron complex outermembrane receptor protein